MNTKLLKQRILDLAIHGRLVPQNPDDEPASQLLRRISEENEKLIAQCKIKRPKKSDALNPAQECPFEIPNSWEWVNLNNICDIKGGKRIPQGMSFAKEPTSHIYIRVTDMKNNTILSNDLKYIDDNVFEKIKNYLISYSDLYLTIAGTIGAVGEVPKMFDGMNLTENAAKLTNIQCNKKYLMFVLMSTIAQEHFKSKFHQVAQPKLSIETAQTTLIPLPPLAEQQRIVSAIEKWFSLIDEIETNKESLQAAIKQTKSKVLDLAIKGKLVSQDINDEPASELLKRINKEKENLIAQGKIKRPKKSDEGNAIQEFPFEIPDSWEWVKLGEIAEDMSDGPFGSNLKKEHYTDKREARIIQLSNIGENGWREDNTRYTTFSHATNNICRSIVQPGDLVIAKMMPAGRTIICPNHEKMFVLSSDAIKLVLYKDFDKQFILDVLNSPFCRKCVGSGTQGIGRERTSIIKLKNLYIPLPPLSEQTRIVSKIEEVFALLDEIERELE